MDPKKQNDYFNKTEYASKVYRIGSAMDNVRSNGPYIADNRVQLPTSKKICDCNNTHSNDKMCNECQPTAAARHLVENQRWSTEPTQRTYISINTQNVIKQNTNSIYVQQANSSSRSYWTHGKAPIVEDSIVKCKHPYVLQQVQPTQHLSTQPPPPSIEVANIGGEPYKDGTYNFDAHTYAPKDELVTNPKVTYSVSSATKARPTTICSIDIRNKSLESIQNKNDHVVNPVNDLSLKEPDLSPNYARKCPQIFSAVNEHNEAHLNLYMTAPHFSTDKFSVISHNEPMIPKRDLRPSGIRSNYSNYNTSTKIISEENKVISVGGYLAQNQYQPHNVKKTHLTTRQQPIQRTYYPGNIATHTNYYESIPAKIITPDYASTPTIPTHQSTSDLYQYSKSPISLPQPIPVISAPNCDEVSYVKKEDIPYDDPEFSKHNNSYLNAYNGPAPFTSETTRIKKESSPFTTTTEQPLHDYRFTYDPVKMGQATSTNINAIVKPSRESVCYYTHQNTTILSPQSSLLPSPHLPEMSAKIQPQRIQSQQNNIVQPFPESTHIQYNPTKHMQSLVKPINETVNVNCSIDQSRPVICYNMNNESQSPLATQHSSFPVQQLPQATSFMAKKTQVPKPNYRELINQVYAMRNATSEQELNMKIIKKTLNVDSSIHAIRTQEAASTINNMPVSTIDQRVLPVPNVSGIDIMDMKTIQKQHIISQQIPSPLIPQVEYVNVKSNDRNGTFKLEEKSNSNNNSPLDLSMRTVKTCADSTEYKYKPLPATSMKSEYKSISTNSLPRVDFQPNFALHTEQLQSSTSNKSSVHMLVEKRNDYINRQINNSVPLNTFRGIENSEVALQLPVCEKSYESIPAHQDSVIITKQSKTNRNAIGPINYNGNKTLEFCNTELKIPHRIVEVAPPDTSVIKSEPQMILESSKLIDITADAKVPLITAYQAPAKKVIVPTSTSTCAEPKQLTAGDAPQSAYITEVLRNPRFLGKKRHLREYSNLKYTEQLNAKQTRLTNEPSDIPNKVEYTNNIDANIIDISKEATLPESKQGQIIEKPMQQEVPYGCEIAKANTVIEMPPLKLEANTFSNCVKAESNLLIASRIRTKAELKGFTFHATPSVAVEISQPNAIIVKEENISNEKNTITDLNDEFNENSLLDFSWRRTCNSFVEQLLTTNTNSGSAKLAATTIIAEKLNQSITPTTKLAMPFYEKFPPTKADNVVQGKSVIQKKNIRIDREKLRLQQEKRLAARLQGGSSSETENELDKQKTERLKKPNIKPKTRPTGATSYSSKSHFSDCGSDTSSSESQSNTLKLRKHNKLANKKATSERSHNKVCKMKIYDDSSMSGDEFHGREKKDIVINKNIDNSSRKPDAEIEKRLDNNNIILHQTSLAETKSILKITNNKSSPNSKTKEKNKSNQIYAKVALNTMTRSKRKRELELQLANSKVLRNEKIIRNSTAKIKRKYVRKYGGNQSTSNKDVISTSENNSQIIVTRLRSKRDKGKPASLALRTQPKNRQATKKNEKKVKGKAYNNGSCKNRDGQTDSILEFYRYKRALKIPPSLITIRRFTNHKTAESLPDLETKQREFELSDFRKQRGKSLHADCAPNTTSIAKRSEEPKSIIDVLHSRVVNTVNSTSHGNGDRTNSVNILTSKLMNNRSAGDAKFNGPTELLATMKQSVMEKNTMDDDDEDDDDDGDDDEEVNTVAKKKHFSIFETKVLQTKTRTESKMQQRREFIREIFVGNDRPASAPPEMTQQSLDGLGICSSEAITYEQKFEQFIQQMNEENIQNFGRPLHLRTTTHTTAAAIIRDNVIKIEESVSSCASAIDTEDRSIDCNESAIGITVNKAIVMPNSILKRRRPAKYLRRKGSSGFDYLRKKKRSSNTTAAATCSSNATCSIAIKSERCDEEYKYKVKTESDVCREIQKWVLNKGVGQSTMHKAARLGYIDVIVYCLDRMGMNPDQKDNAGYTPLHEACTNGWLDIARLLLMYGANHSEAALSGIRPLHEASENDHEEIVRLLLSYGADPLLATYSDQTPLMMASSPIMRDLLNSHLSDVQSVGSNRKPWHFNGPWEILESSECGFNIFKDAPGLICDMSSALRKRSVSSMITRKNLFKQCEEKKPLNEATKVDNCMKKTVNDKVKECSEMETNSVHTLGDKMEPMEYLFNNSDNDGEIFEFEEADVLLPPLYLLKDEGTDKWVLLSDLCNLLKVKSKDTLLNKIFPSSSMSVAHKSLMRELKMSDFLEKATCLQLLCAGEKFNICASKVVLIKYNESVKNLLGVKTILMKF